MAKSKKKPKTAVVPMTFNSPVTPIGVDASWTGLAVTALELDNMQPAKWRVRLSEVLSTKPADFPSQAARMESLGCRFMEAVMVGGWLGTPDDPVGPITTKLVAIEGYAMGSKTRPQMAGELGGHLKLLLWQAGIPYVVVPPTSVKKYVTGKGVAPKDIMLKEVFRRWGYDTSSNDRADAYALARIAAEFAAGGWTKKFEGLAQGFEVVGVKGGGS